MSNITSLKVEIQKKLLKHWTLWIKNQFFLFHFYLSVENIEIEIQNEEHEASEEESVVDNGNLVLCMIMWKKLFCKYFVFFSSLFALHVECIVEIEAAYKDEIHAQHFNGDSKGKFTYMFCVIRLSVDWLCVC